MATQIELSEDGRYVLVTQTGPLSPADIKQARIDSLSLYANCDRALVDYRLADLKGIRLLDLDTLSLEFKRDVPKCLRMAIVRPRGVDEKSYAHLANVCTINDVKTLLFEDMERARIWLIDD